jgi:hypothetical protein
LFDSLAQSRADAMTGTRACVQQNYESNSRLTAADYFFPVEHSRLFTENLLQARTANILFVGSPECVLPDASGKFFAHFQFRWRIQF